jgi:alkylated DNA repair dioxygenase AlkB
MIKYSFTHKNDLSSKFFYIKNFLDKEEQNELFEYLEGMDDFRPCINFKNKANRFQKWYQEENKYFCPTWKHRFPRWESFSYDKILNGIQKKIQKKMIELGLLKINFNSCLINKYVNGEDYIHFHRDSIQSFGEYPVIVGLSVGSDREIKFKKIKYDEGNLKSIKTDRDHPIRFKMKLESGSLFIMSGSSQKYFGHEIERCNTKEMRYSLTYRKFIL